MHQRNSPLVFVPSDRRRSKWNPESVLISMVCKRVTHIRDQLREGDNGKQLLSLPEHPRSRIDETGMDGITTRFLF